MSLIEWTNDISVGIASIDEQHKKLIAMLNELYNASNDGLGAQAVGQTLSGLIQYTIEHFQYEEQLFAQTNYPAAEEHKREHEELTRTVMDIREKFQEKPSATMPQEVLQFLVKWILDHTMGSDKNYSAHLIAAGVK
jgi:hemerythrin